MDGDGGVPPICCKRRMAQWKSAELPAQIFFLCLTIMLIFSNHHKAFPISGASGIAPRQVFGQAEKKKC